MKFYNATSGAINLNGLDISDSGSDSFVIGRTLVIESDDYLVLGKNADTASNGNIDMDYAYTSQMTLSNSDDEIILQNDLGLVDMVAWDNGQTFVDPTGASMNLDPTSYNESANDSGSNWCESTSLLSSGDYGTPGEDNESCGSSVTYTYTNDVYPILNGAGCVGLSLCTVLESNHTVEHPSGRSL